MADEGMLALRDAVGKILASEHADVLREGGGLVLREVMELEAAQVAGAERYERSSERQTYRNGYRPREFDTRVGTIELAIPQAAAGRPRGITAAVDMGGRDASPTRRALGRDRYGGILSRPRCARTQPAVVHAHG